MVKLSEACSARKPVCACWGRPGSAGEKRRPPLNPHLQALPGPCRLIDIAAQTPSFREGSSRIFWIFTLVQDVGVHGFQSSAAA